MNKRQTEFAGFHVFEYVPMGICVLDENFDVVYWNGTLEDWTGITKPEIIGESIKKFYAHFGDAKYKMRFQSVFHGGPPIIFSSQLHANLLPSKLPNGELRVQQTTVTPVPLGENQTTQYALLTVEDVTELATRIKDYRSIRNQAVDEIRQRRKSEESLKIAVEEAAATEIQLRRAILRSNHMALVAQMANKAKSQFLANMSHELKTPLNSIIVLSRMLQERMSDNLTERQLEFADTIHQAGTELLALIDSILDLSKMEEGKVEFNVDTIVLDEFVKNIVTMCKPLALHKGLGFHAVVEKGTPPHILNDQQFVGQILRNLVSNAIKFTDHGGVENRVYSPPPGVILDESRLTHEQAIAFSVKDTGVGISEDKQSTIFGPFAQEDGTTSRKYGGTGLGLYISEGLATSLGGELHVESEKGKGSNFILYLPLEVSADRITELHEEQTITGKIEKIKLDIERHSDVDQLEDPAFAAEQATEESGLRSIVAFQARKVLLVDEDMRNVFTLPSILQEKGLDVLVAKNGGDGLEQLRRNSDVELLLVSVSMSDMDGYQMVKKVRETERWRELPVFMMTQKKSDNEKEFCLKAGANEVFAKPLDVKKLLVVMKAYLEHG